MIPKDKIYHAIAGTVIFLICLTFMPAWMALLAATIAGILKEIYDYLSYGKYEILDFVCTIFIPLIIMLFL